MYRREMILFMLNGLVVNSIDLVIIIWILSIDVS